MGRKNCSFFHFRFLQEIEFKIKNGFKELTKTFVFALCIFTFFSNSLAYKLSHSFRSLLQDKDKQNIPFIRA